ncbi:hypothetical protein-transmembrane prediction [Rhodopirellula baltica SH 1]|uniref:Uncharacterized protein n=1 Tax=Rhodopirellula baltica (strain DSM 10527 / NCIMB 13988 / SH1) TaxID=243090 RepID=Q7URY1_RHOBA|nr:hypothetical protein-transmembrane prediction [Rhodopirellula baltica SH 1]
MKSTDAPRVIYNRATKAILHPARAASQSAASFGVFVVCVVNILASSKC